MTKQRESNGNELAISGKQRESNDKLLGGITGKGFMPGKSGNPSGRALIPKEIKEAAKEFTWEALETVKSLMRDPKCPPHVRLRAAEVLLDRGWGKPMPYLPIEENEHQNILVIMDK